MSRKSKWLLCAIALVLAGTVYFGGIFAAVSSTRPAIRFHSDMSLMNAAITEGLRDYHDREGRYPNDLEVLSEPIVRGLYPGTPSEKPK